MEIYGNTKGIKKTVLASLEGLEGDYDRNLLIDRDVLASVCAITEKINREICVSITRSGRIAGVGIGDASSVSLGDLSLRRGEARFSGIRVIHTHPSGRGRLSEPDEAALKSLRLDLMCAVGVLHGRPDDLEIGYIDGSSVEKFHYKKLSLLSDDLALRRIAEHERDYVSPVFFDTAAETPSAVLVNVNPDGDAAAVETEELRQLCGTLGVRVAAEVIQRQRADKTYCAGRGKLDEIKRLIQVKNAGFVIFNNRLSGNQRAAAEEYLGVRVTDRAMVILEIFARHAVSGEGKLQVELAMLKYALPGLLGQGKVLSRIGGGGGGEGAATKGSGETKLETDRRRIRREMVSLSKRIEELKRDRDLRRSRRVRSGIRTVAIVGYTNSGKSTLMNALADADALVEDKLFATLDPVTRRVRAPGGREYLITDTVGFIDNLPHEFVDAFRSTLEEASHADLLLKVTDCAAPGMERRERVVDETLASLGAGDTPSITVYNKADLNSGFSARKENSAVVSALSGDGIPALKKTMEEKLFG